MNKELAMENKTGSLLHKHYNPELGVGVGGNKQVKNLMKALKLLMKYNEEISMRLRG